MAKSKGKLTLRDVKVTSYQQEKIGNLTISVPLGKAIKESKLVGYDNIVQDCQASWLEIANANPLNFRIIGPPGVGKNEIVNELARIRKQNLFVIQGHEDLTPEDLVCTARIKEKQEIEYVASPLVGAMLYGGIALIDELDKIPPRSLSVLASLLDERRSVYSVLAGFELEASKDFRFCAIVNDTTSSSYKLPDYIEQRTRPFFFVDYPSQEQIQAILESRFKENIKDVMDTFLELTKNKKIAPREAIQIINYTLQILNENEGDKTLEKVLEEVIERIVR